MIKFYSLEARDMLTEAEIGLRVIKHRPAHWYLPHMRKVCLQTCARSLSAGLDA